MQNQTFARTMRCLALRNARQDIVQGYGNAYLDTLGDCTGYDPAIAESSIMNHAIALSPGRVVRFTRQYGLRVLKLLNLCFRMCSHSLILRGVSLVSSKHY